MLELLENIKEGEGGAIFFMLLQPDVFLLRQWLLDANSHPICHKEENSRYTKASVNSDVHLRWDCC